MYRTLDVDFDVWIGEAFFEREMKATVKELMDAHIAERSEGAVVVKLDDVGLPPALIQKSDGASLYLTRDIANLRYRLKKYKPAKILYVVGNEQALAFEQLFAVAKKLGWDAGRELKHIKYGLVLASGGKKLSTREGTAELLEGVIDEAVTKRARGDRGEKSRSCAEGKGRDRDRRWRSARCATTTSRKIARRTLFSIGRRCWIFPATAGRICNTPTRG